VEPLNYYELMPLLLAKEDGLCQKIVLCSRIISAYFLVAFPEGRFYVYRARARSAEEFAAELQERIHERAVEVVKEIEQNREAVQVVELSPAARGEVDDPYWEPDLKHHKYHHAFHLHNDISLFKMEHVVEEQAVFKQTFFTTIGKFPGLTYRLPIDPSKTVVRRFPANVCTVKQTTRRAFEIRTQTLYFMYLNKVGLPPTNQDIAAFLEQIRAAAQEAEGNASTRSVGADASVKEALRKQTTAAKYALEVLKPYCPEEDHAATWSLFG
jgi:hypothetical protein